MRMTKKVMTEVVKQELKDFKEEMFKRLDRIETQTKKTNGSVAETIKELALVQQAQENCPARKHHAIGSRFQKTQMYTSIVAVIIASISIIIVSIR